MPSPKPAPADEAQATNDQQDEALREAVDEEMDELTEATERAAEEATESGGQDPFDGSEDIDDLDLADVDVGDPVSDSGSPFDGVDDSDSPSDPSASGGEPSEEEFEDFFDDTSEELDALKTSINEGAARFAVLGLDEDDGKDDLEEEFQEIFTAFRLGHFGAHAADEYLLASENDIDPVWGFLGAALLCSVTVVWRRPDGDEITDSAKERMNTLSEQIQA